MLTLQVLPTRTLYTFEAGGIRLGVTFTTPALPHDLELLSRPVTYLTWTVEPADGRTHQVSVYFDATGDTARIDQAFADFLTSIAGT